MKKVFCLAVVLLCLAWPAVGEESTPPTEEGAAEPQWVTAKVITKPLKNDPPIDRSPARVAMEGGRKEPTEVRIPLGRPNWREQMKQLGISERAKRKLLLSKREHTLKLIADGQVVGVYPVGFARNYLNDKLEQGDKTSPEGVFRVAHKHPSKKTHRSLCLNYPTAETHRKRARARKLGIPLKNDPGSDICIHGHGIWKGETFFQKDGQYFVKNWTRGCPTLNDELMEEVYDFAHSGMEVEIVW
jgi:L,D-transpeptidase catalytic domain